MDKPTADQPDEHPDFAHAKQAWQQAVSAALGGQNANKLARKTLDGLLRGPLAMQKEPPLATGRPGQFPFTRGTKPTIARFQPWDIRSQITPSHSQTLNQQVLQQLEGGANSVFLPAGQTKLDLPTLLTGVDLQLAGIGLLPQIGGHDMAQDLSDFWQNSGVDLTQIKGDLGLSPIGFSSPKSTVTSLAKWAAEHAPNLRTLSLGTDLIHEAGGTEALELAWLCAETAENMRLLLTTGLSGDQAASQMLAYISLDADLHLGICKLRAARRVWAQVIASFGGSDAASQLPILAQSSRRMLSRHDPWVNILRISTAGFAAVLGGAQIICLNPFSYRLGAPSPMAQRLAINSQLVLLEECAAARVIDPAGGSYAHEQLTDQLANKAWQYFQQIETEGGLQQAINTGWIAKQIEQMRVNRQQLIRQRKLPIIGVSQYAQSDETPIELADTTPPKPEQNACNLSQFYDAGEFEQLRDLANTKDWPSVFLASLGSLSQSAGRTGFCRNLLTAGGIKTSGGKAWKTQQAMIDDFTASKSPLAIVCATDEQYKASATALAEQLKSAGAKQVWIAGGPAIAQTLDRRLAAGNDAIADLQAMTQILAGDDR